MRIAVFCLCWILILTAPGVMAQQGVTPNQSWDVLRQLPPGNKLRVEKKIGNKKFSGKFISVSDTELIIERKGKNESYARDEVKNLWSVKSPSRKKRTILTSIGAGAGIFLGALAALAIVFSHGGSEGSANAAMIGISVGGAVGGYALAGTGKKTLIYSAP